MVPANREMVNLVPQGQWENLWSAEHYHRLELASDEDVIDKIAYVAANPTEAGLVESPEEWPGVMLLPEGEVRTLEIRRPGKYFTNDRVFPESVTLHVTPMAARQPSNAELPRRVAVAIEHAVARARDRRATALSREPRIHHRLTFVGGSVAPLLGTRNQPLVTNHSQLATCERFCGTTSSPRAPRARAPARDGSGQPGKVNLVPVSPVLPVGNGQPGSGSPP
jgi:hypothetical protein